MEHSRSSISWRSDFRELRQHPDGDPAGARRQAARNRRHRRAALGAVPNIPTIAESGVPGYQVSNWFGISTRAGTSPEVVARLHADIARALKTPEIKAAFDNAGADAGDMTPAQFAAFFKDEYRSGRRW